MKTPELHIYAPVNRPPEEAAPHGWQNVPPPADFPDFYRYGLIGYPRKLTAQEIYDYELHPFSPNIYDFQVGDRVVVNECDPGKVLEQLPLNCYLVQLDYEGMIVQPKANDVEKE